MTAAVAIATLFALGGTAAALFAPPLAGTASSQSGAREVVVGFYDAIDQALATGDMDALDAATMPGLVIHDVGGVDQDRRALTQRLTGLRAIAPAARVNVDEVVLDGDRAMARLHATGDQALAARGLPGEADWRVWPPIEILRLVNDRVAEGWAVGADGPVLQPLIQTGLETGWATPAPVSFARFTFAAAANSADVAAPTSVAFLVEAGALRIRLAAGEIDDGQRHVQPIDRELHAGDAIVVPRGARFAVGNAAAEPAVALAAAPTWALTIPGTFLRDVFQPGDGGRTQTARWPSGVSVRALRSAATWSVPTPLAIAVARVTIAPGAMTTPQRLRRIELLAAESGRFDVVAAGPATDVDRGDGHAPAPGPNRVAGGCGATGSLTAGGTATLYPGAVVSLCNAGADPAVIFVISIIPASPGASAA